jgi:hypothetical protein
MGDLNWSILMGVDPIATEPEDLSFVRDFDLFYCSSSILKQGLNPVAIVFMNFKADTK